MSAVGSSLSAWGRARRCRRPSSGVSYYRERVPLYAWEKPTIGLIVCESAGRDEVRFALAGLEEKIFVAEYQVRLPTAERIKERLRELADASASDETT